MEPISGAQSTGVTGLALEQTFPDADFDSMFQSFLEPPGAGNPCIDALGEPLGADFAWPSDKAMDDPFGGDASSTGAGNGSPSHLDASSGGDLGSLQASSPTSNPTHLDASFSMPDLELAGSAAPPSRTSTPPLAASGAASAHVTPTRSAHHAGQYGDSTLAPEQETLQRAGADNGATSSQQTEDNGSAQSPCMGWPLAPHMQQQAPHQLKANSAPLGGPYGFGGCGMQHPALKGGGSGHGGYSNGMPDASAAGIDFGAGMAAAAAAAPFPPGAMWMGGGPGSMPAWPPQGPMFMQQPGSGEGNGRRQLKMFSDAGDWDGGSMASGGHFSSGSGNSSQSAFAHPALTAQAFPPQQSEHPPPRQQQQLSQEPVEQEAQPQQALHQQQQLQHATRPRSQRRAAAVKRDAPSSSPPPTSAHQTVAAAHSAFGQPMPPQGMFAPAPHNGYGLPSMGPQLMGGFSMGGFGGVALMAGSVPGGTACAPPGGPGFVATSLSQQERATAHKSWEGASPRGAYSSPGTPRSEALVLEELKQLIGQLDAATKSTMKDSLYRISRNAQGSTGAEESGAQAARAAAAAQKKGANDAIGPVDRMVADLLYKEPVQQAPDLPRALAETARQQARKAA